MKIFLDTNIILEIMFEREFADFVFDNRMNFQNTSSLCVHNYLLVGGVMSDGQQVTDFIEYRKGEISKEELYRRLCIPKEDW